MRRALGVALVALLAAAPAAADRGGYAIAAFDVSLEVLPSSDLIVEEQLAVDFSEPRHGIYRMIPVSYTDPRGYLYSLGFRLIEVLDASGNAHQTEVTREGRYVKVRIGDPDRTVTGRVVYRLRYRVRDAVAHFAEHDEIYWNATGNEWQATIGSASARVVLPGSVERESIEADAYTGVFGSREQEAVIEFPEPGVVSYRATQPLEPLEGLTVVAAWPHGLVSFPGPFTRAARFLADNWIVLAPILALAFLVHRHRAVGKDPEGPASVMVRYQPPPELTPGEIGALVDEQVDLRDITATVVDLAIRGYLRIRVEKQEKLFGLLSDEETWFERTDRDTQDLRGYERQILSGIFASGDVVKSEDLEHKFYTRIPRIKESLWNDLAARKFIDQNPLSVKKRYLVAGAVAAGVTIVVGQAWARSQGAVFPDAGIAPIASGVLVGALFFWFSRFMPRRTPRGVEMRAWALGFQEFVDRVEKESLEAAERRNAFEALLPFAMALGVASAWARRFEDVYRSAPPVWFYGSSSTSGFSTSSFERTLTGAMARAGSGMQAAPRSSGSGGGGSSGGGGGGGGGGSW